MTELYPIGTELIMHELSQAALFAEIFPHEVKLVKELDFLNNELCRAYPYEDWERCVYSFPFFIARITVTEENQKWLSPVPISGDIFAGFREGETELTLGQVECTYGDAVDTKHGILYFKFQPKESDALYFVPNDIQKSFIKERTYPNGQRFPLIEFDEVVLP